MRNKVKTNDKKFKLIKTFLLLYLWGKRERGQAKRTTAALNTTSCISCMRIYKASKKWSKSEIREYESIGFRWNSASFRFRASVELPKCRTILQVSDHSSTFALCYSASDAKCESRLDCAAWGIRALIRVICTNPSTGKLHAVLFSSIRVEVPSFLVLVWSSTVCQPEVTCSHRHSSHRWGVTVRLTAHREWVHKVNIILIAW